MLINLPSGHSYLAPRELNPVIRLHKFIYIYILQYKVTHNGWDFRGDCTLCSNKQGIQWRFLYRLCKWFYDLVWWCLLSTRTALIRLIEFRICFYCILYTIYIKNTLEDVTLFWALKLGSTTLILYKDDFESSHREHPLRKELNHCHKLKFSNPYILATWWSKPLIFQTYII